MCTFLYQVQVVKQKEQNAWNGQDESNNNILYHCNFQILNNIFGSWYEKSYVLSRIYFSFKFYQYPFFQIMWYCVGHD